MADKAKSIADRMAGLFNTAEEEKAQPATQPSPNVPSDESFSKRLKKSLGMKEDPKALF